MFSFFQSSELKLSVKAVEQIANSNKNLLSSSYVENLAKQVLKDDKEKTIHSIKIDGLSYNALAFLVMSNVIYSELTSGKHHIYRGTLNAMGKSIRQFWPIICAGLVNEGFSSQDHIKLDTTELDEEISSIG